MNRSLTLVLLFVTAIASLPRASQAQALRLEVLPTTLETWISNPNAVAISIDAYQIGSNQGLLDPLGWVSVEDAAAANPAAVSAALGSGALSFAEPGGLNPFFLGESNLTDVGTWQPGTRWSIGFPFSSLPNPLQTTFEYASPGTSLVTGGVVILPEPTALMLLALGCCSLFFRRRAYWLGR